MRGSEGVDTIAKRGENAARNGYEDRVDSPRGRAGMG